MSDPRAFKRALAEAARQVADAGGPEIPILTELDCPGRRLPRAVKQGC